MNTCGKVARCLDASNHQMGEHPWHDHQKPTHIAANHSQTTPRKASVAHSVDLFYVATFNTLQESFLDRSNRPHPLKSDGVDMDSGNSDQLERASGNAGHQGFGQGRIGRTLRALTSLG